MDTTTDDDYVDIEVPMRLLFRAPAGTDIDDVTDRAENLFEHGSIREALQIAFDEHDASYDGYAFARTPTFEEAQQAFFDAERVVVQAALTEVVDVISRRGNVTALYVDETDQDMSGALVFHAIELDGLDPTEAEANLYHDRLSSALGWLNAANADQWRFLLDYPDEGGPGTPPWRFDLAALRDHVRPGS